MKKYKYIDDERYAFNYVRFHQEKLSKQQLTVKLSQKGVNKELITAALESEYEADDEEKIRTGKKLVKTALFSYIFILAIDLVLSAIQSLI